MWSWPKCSILFPCSKHVWSTYHIHYPLYTIHLRVTDHVLDSHQQKNYIKQSSHILSIGNTFAKNEDRAAFQWIYFTSHLTKRDFWRLGACDGISTKTDLQSRLDKSAVYSLACLSRSLGFRSRHVWFLVEENT